MSSKTGQLCDLLPPIILGGAGFSEQLDPDPHSLPVNEIILHAFDLGFRAIDTSPYYGSSEVLLGKALSHPEFIKKYHRNDYILMTKAGRISSAKFDYSPEWIRSSVSRSLERFNTSYLDVVFCHDIEYVTTEEAVTAVGTLFQLAEEGKVKWAGVSSYRIDLLIEVANKVWEKYGRPIDIVQNWGQLTLQNDRLETEGLNKLHDAGVSCVCSSSPLAIGLLRSGGVPVGALGDFHPAPAGLREAAQRAADHVTQNGDELHPWL